MTDYIGIIERIFFLYRDHTQAEIGAVVGVSQDLVSGWKRGLSNPRVPELMKITEDRGVSWDWLMTGEGAMDPPTNVEIPGEDVVSPDRSGEYPIVGYAAADDAKASRAEFLDDSLDFGAIDFPYAMAAVAIRGDSMSPVVLDNQYVLIEPVPVDVIATGTIAVINVSKGGEDFPEEKPGVYCKRLQVAGDVYVLTSINTIFNEPFSVLKQNVAVYPVLGVWFGERGVAPHED